MSQTKNNQGGSWEKGDVLLSAGSNLGERESYLKRAEHKVQALPGVYDFCASSVFFTQPQLLKEQDWFANQVFLLRCDNRWSPMIFLSQLMEIERELGRVRNKQYGPRTIDLDILLFGRTISNSSELVLPHPRLHQRAFVLVPLLEIRPHFLFPDGESVLQKLSRLHYRQDGSQIWQDDAPDLST